MAIPEERLAGFYDITVSKTGAKLATDCKRKLEYLQQLCMYHNIDYDEMTAHDMGIFKYHINVAYATGFVNTASLREFVALLSKRYPSEDNLEPRKTWLSEP